jgi:hypothetical protein
MAPLAGQDGIRALADAEHCGCVNAVRRTSSRHVSAFPGHDGLHEYPEQLATVA